MTSEAIDRPQPRKSAVARHSTLNFLGSVVPSLVSFVTVPIYFRLIGAERFGVLSIAWLFLGYFGLFDLGLGSATSFRIAALRDAAPEARSRTFWTAIVVNLGLGVFGASVLWLAGDFFFSRVFKVDPHLRLEMVAGVPFLAAAVPMATLGGVLYGSLQGREKFLSTNVVSTVSTILFQIVPIVVVLIFGPYLPLILVSAILARSCGLLLMIGMCYFELVRGNKPKIASSEVKILLGYGAWVTVAAISGPVLVFADRFAIGAIIGAVAVATYTVPFQLAQRINIIPSSLTMALFPRLVRASDVEHDRLSQIMTLTIASLLSAPVLIGIVLLRPFLDIWVGAAIATKAAPVGRLLLIGFWLNAFAYVPQMRLQAAGRPKVVALILVLQIAPYLGALYVGMTYFGLMGCAVVFCIRNAADWLMLAWIARAAFRGWPILLLNLTLLVLAAWLVETWAVGPAQYAALAAVLLAMLVIGWRSLPSEAKQLILVEFRRLRGGAASHV